MKVKYVQEVKYNEDRTATVPITRALWFWCPGCDAAHRIVYEKLDPSYAFPVWTLRGEGDNITLSPSILVDKDRPVSRCHSYVKNGQIQFLPDCSHALAGKTVDLPTLPAWL